MRKRLLYALQLISFVFLLFALAAPVLSQPASKKEKLIFFFSQACHNCREVKEGILSDVLRDYGSRIEIEYRDIENIDNYRLLLGIREKLDVSTQIQGPAVYFGGQLLIGQDKIENTLLQLIGQSAGAAAADASGRIPPIDLVSHFKSFTPVAVIGAGLIDGINPCAFTVIVFFISFLSLQGYSRRELVIIGAAFILSVFLTYLSLGLGLFNFFYSFKGVLSCAGCLILASVFSLLSLGYWQCATL